MENLELELGKVSKYARHKKFSPEWNRSISFIYNVYEYEEIIRQSYIVSKQRGFETNEFVLFAITRWYNFHSNAYVGSVIGEFPEISIVTDDHQNRKLEIKGEIFDYRCTFYPRQFHLPLDYSVKKPLSLLRWFYQNQNRNVYFGNRLFVIMHDRKNPGSSWKLRGQLGNVKQTFTEQFGSGIEVIDFEFSKNNATYNPKCIVVFLLDRSEERQLLNVVPEMFDFENEESNDI